MRPPALLLAACLALVAAVPARAADAPARRVPLGASRLDPRLLGATRADADPVAVWVEFADKGEQGPADLASKLAAAAAALTPEARHRREKAHVQPLVDYLDLPLEPSYVQALEEAGYQVYGQSRWFNRVAVHTSGVALERLASLSFVRHVTPVELSSPRPREPMVAPAVGEGPPPGRFISAAEQTIYGGALGQLSRLNIPAVHDSGYIGYGINVCMLDDGFNYYRKHEALKTIPIGGGRTRDFIRGIVSVQDTVDQPSSFEHGTMTLSQVAGRASGRYMGSAYGCNAILGRTEYDPTETPIEMVYWGQGAEWADSLGADIISSSLGYNIFDPPNPSITYPMLDGHTSTITRAAEIAAAKGILVVVSAGNDGTHSYVGYKIGAPADANGDSVIAIGALDSLGNRALFSSKGPTFDGRIKPDLSAQGVANLLAEPYGDPNAYTRASGTSFSAPLVAGLAACLMQARPTWPPVMIIQALKHTASSAAAPDTLVGWGLPDGLAALRYVPDTLHAPAIRGPLAMSLSGPNPLRAGGAPIRLHLSLGADAAPAGYRLRVFDASGRVVRDLGAGSLPPGGVRDVAWRGDDASGHALVPGLYFLALDGAGRRGTARVIVLR
jgi:subtilisin family serine protease